MAKRRRYGYRRKRKKDDGTEILVWMFAIAGTIIVWFFVSMFKFIVWIFTALGNLISNSGKKTPVKRTTAYGSNATYSSSSVNKYTPKKLTNNNINFKEDIKYETKTIQVPKYKVVTPYDALFSDLIKTRGLEYFNSNKISDYKLEEQICSATINGTEKYNTTITFYKNNKLKKAECSCPYFQKENVYCKHIYALILNYCKTENIEGFSAEKYFEEKKETHAVNGDNLYSKMIAICNAMQEIINNTEDYYNELEDSFEIEDIYSEIMQYEEKIKFYQNIKMSELSQVLINKAQDDLNNMESLYDDLEFEIDDENYGSESENKNSDTIAAMFVAHQMDKQMREREEQEAYDDEHEQLKNDWGLLDWEADLVQKGDYDPWNFEEPGSGDELDEDDYYYDDDD